jgi:hypothetical protein
VHSNLPIIAKMLARFPRIVGIVILTFLVLAWLYGGDSSRSLAKPSNNDGKQFSSPKAKTGGQSGRVHYADVPDSSASTTSSAAYVAVPTDAVPVIKARTPYAYVFWATSDMYACSALIGIRRLIDFHTPHKLHILVTEGVSEPYREEFEKFNVTVHEVEVPEHPHPNPNAKALRLNQTTEMNLVKLHAFRMHQLDDKVRRVVIMDADQFIYHPLDTLFSSPEADLAAPRNYWDRGEASAGMLATTLMVINPSDRVWKSVETEVKNLVLGEYADVVVNRVFKDSAAILPGAYGAVDDHWYFWYLPKWYRPEIDKFAISQIEDYSKADLKDLWRVINMHMEEKPKTQDPSVKEDGTIEGQPPAEGDAAQQNTEKRSLKKRALEGEDLDELDEEMAGNDAAMGELLTPEDVKKEKADAEVDDKGMLSFQLRMMLISHRRSTQRRSTRKDRRDRQDRQD